MIEEYKEDLILLKAELSKVGMSLVEDTDFIAEFKREDGWQLIFEGERYNRELVDIEVVPPNGDIGFSLRLLMKTYQKIERKKLPMPTLVNQISFFMLNLDGWLLNVEKYKMTYKNLNEIY